jgi:hypothetical protein
MNPPFLRVNCTEGPNASRLVSFFRFLKEFAEAVEAALPNRPVIRDPTFQDVESRRFDAAGAYTPYFFGARQSALLQQLEMLRDRGEGDAQWFGQCRDGKRTERQPIEQRTARWIAQSQEQAIDIHLRKGCGAATGCRTLL